MNNELSILLEDAIDNYNEEVCEDNRLYWWDILNEMSDLTDDEQVLRVIVAIENETEKLKAGVFA